jgi:hypothetical protein
VTKYTFITVAAVGAAVKRYKLPRCTEEAIREAARIIHAIPAGTAWYITKKSGIDGAQRIVAWCKKTKRAHNALYADSMF